MSILLTRLFKNYYKICECGCGELMKILDKYGRIRKFINGHNSKLLKGEKSWSWKGGRFKNGGGYFLIYKPNHPNCDKKGYILEHRFIIEQHIGRYLTKKEEVHHKNGITDDNRIENLQLLSKAEHRSITKLKNLDDRRCSKCGSDETFMRETKLNGLRPIWYRNEKNGYLCHKCRCKLCNRARTSATVLA